MISEFVLGATIRTECGTGESRRLRRTGQIPACIYGMNSNPLSVSVNGKQLGSFLRTEEGRNSIFTLDVASKEQPAVLIHDLQVDPVKGSINHIDFLRVDLTARMVVKIPLHLIGEPVGVKLDGGILEHGVRTIEVECLPKDIPGHIDVSVSHLKLGQHVYVGDVQLNENLKLVSDVHNVVAVVIAPRGAEVVASTEVSEPEVAKKGKAEE